ncbi:MAG: 2-oxoglutarate ferredoxin oxidoreductase subunit alpha, partial [Fidelibacterota bacterium]
KGALRSAVTHARNEGKSVSHVHLRYINPFPKNLGELLLKFKKVLIPELNLGQLATIIRAKYLIDTVSFNKLQGKPFKTAEIYERIITEIEG